MLILYWRSKDYLLLLIWRDESTAHETSDEMKERVLLVRVLEFVKYGIVTSWTIGRIKELSYSFWRRKEEDYWYSLGTSSKRLRRSNEKYSWRYPFHQINLVDTFIMNMLRWWLIVYKFFNLPCQTFQINCRMKHL